MFDMWGRVVVMLLAQIRWRTLAEFLPTDVPQHVFDDDDVVRVLDILEDVLAERSDWVAVDSPEFADMLSEAREEGGESVGEAMRGVMSDVLYRERMFQETVALTEVDDLLGAVDVRETIREEW